MTCWQELCEAIILEAAYQAVDFWDGDRTFSVPCYGTRTGVGARR